MRRLRGLFQQYVPGDEALLRLARLRFEQAGLGAELYAGHPAELDRMLAFAPTAHAPPTVHLDRRLNLLVDRDREVVADFVRRYDGRVDGFIVHDQPQMDVRTEELVTAARRLDADLRGHRSLIYIEYAAGHRPAWFRELGARLADVARVSLCIDIGHVGVHQAHRALAQALPDVTFTDLQHDAGLLADHIDVVQSTVDAALPTVLGMVRGLARTGTPLHLHLHDGHPLIPGVSDHFSFLTQVPLPFPYRGRLALDTMYGPAGLRAIVDTVAATTWPTTPSLLLEIHQTDGRRPLNDAAHLFGHWRDLTNAERTNHWLAVLAENARLL
ncbi:MAG TPA: hypothetical protein VFZ70_00040 [Euzebyales bacterium]